MRLDFPDYNLPPRLIAQYPLAERDRSRLLVVRRSDQSLAHHLFSDLPELLNPGDLLVLNDTRVLPARLLGRRMKTGGKWEGLFLSTNPAGAWELICRTRGRPSEGESIQVEPGPLTLELVGRRGGHWLAKPSESGSPAELLGRYGHVPLPPYIRKGRAVEADRERYQTVYASKAGSVAAPTAGLHFTPALLEKLQRRGIQQTAVTLHVGLGTFQPIQVEDARQHKMHSEWGELPQAAVAAVAACKARGARVTAVGTTSVRVLETAAGASEAAASSELRLWSGETDLFIYSPYTFHVVDALITNFHLPHSTLLLLVAAFAGVDLTHRAYKTAVEQEYRFFSYGDAMLIV
jgi:S-adenosylmethionine:tRNA ribosyltransferase-isomerase